jgi:hypothetical protein
MRAKKSPVENTGVLKYLINYQYKYFNAVTSYASKGRF